MSSARAAPLDPALFAPSSSSVAVPAQAPVASPAALSQAPVTPSCVLQKGDDVWYRHRSGVWMEGRVTYVDLSLDPPSYQVETKPDGTTRDTERPRLKPRFPGEPPPPKDTSALQSAAAPAPQVPAASSAHTSAAAPSRPTQPAQSSPPPMPPASATHAPAHAAWGTHIPQQPASAQAVPSAPPWNLAAPPNNGGPASVPPQHGWYPGGSHNAHGYWNHSPAQAMPGGQPAQPPAPPAWLHGAQQGQPTDAQQHQGPAAAGMYAAQQHQGPAPAGIYQPQQHQGPAAAGMHQAHVGVSQGYPPTGFVPQHAQHSHLPSGYHHYTAGQWPPAQHPGMHGQSNGWQHTPYGAHQHTGHGGPPHVLHGGHNWAQASEPAHTAPGPGAGGATRSWSPFKDNANAMLTQQYPVPHMQGGAAPWPMQGQPEPYPGAAPQATPSQIPAAMPPQAKPIGDLFSGMQIRQ
eukprot:jgi/Ulvmu1/3159/UM015_0199.1